MKIFGRSDLDAAFTPGTVFPCPDNGRIHVRQVEIGDLVLSSGKVVACDPSNLEWERDTVPFVRIAPAGSYPVILSLAAFGAQDAGAARRVACAMVRFRAAKPVTWEMAVRPGQDASTLPAGKFFGYGVDAGMGCFIDNDTLQTVRKQDEDEFYHERILGGMSQGGQYRDWANIVVDPESGSNLVVFLSGYGDGAYASFWGIGAAGELCCLVTDFALLVEGLKGRSTFPLREWIGKALLHPDLGRIGLSVRLLPLGEPPDHRLQVQLQGGSCKAVIANGAKEYSSDRVSYKVSGGTGTFDFVFDEPLLPDAQITLEYRMGVQALEPVA